MTRTPPASPPKNSIRSLISLGFAFVSLLCYGGAVVVFLRAFSARDGSNWAMTVMPQLILCGLGFNVIGIAIAIVGFFFRRERKLICVAALGINAVFPAFACAFAFAVSARYHLFG